MLAALSNGITTLKGPLFSEDTIIFMNALKDLGFEVEADRMKNPITVHGCGGSIPSKHTQVNVANAGTAARFLTAFLTLGNGYFILDGSTRMRQRPIGDLVAALNGLGARVQPHSPASAAQITLPLNIHAKGLVGGTTSIRGDISSQFLSAVLMVAPYAQNPVEICLEGELHSRPYVDLTLEVMIDFGLNIERQGYDYFFITPQCYTSPGYYRIEGDASSASYLFAAPAICGGWVEVANISPNTKQGDIGFLGILAEMGCQVINKPEGVRVIAAEKLSGIDVNMRDISDTAMTLAVIAPFADSPTTIRGITSSRLKESDRIGAICNELKRLGVKVEERRDGMTIYPCDRFLPCKISTYNDHRIAMAFSLIGLRVSGIKIENPACVAKTFPDYFHVLEGLR